MSHHHTTVYKMAAMFLNKDPNYIQAFQDIIVSAHKTVSEKVDKANMFDNVHNHSNQQMSIPQYLLYSNIIDNDKSDMADAATELVATGIDYLKQREKQRDISKGFNYDDYEDTPSG
eukprot:347861_1